MTTPLPPVARRRSLLFALPSVGTRWPGGLRAALAFGIPALVAFAAGFENEALLTVTGGFAIVYGEGRAYRVRPAIILTAGAALMLSALLGGLAGETGSAVAVVASMVTVGVVSTFVVDALRLGPPGAFFFVLVCGVSSVLPTAGIATTTNISCVAIGVASSLLVGMSGALWRPTKPQDDAVNAAVAAVARVTGVRAEGEYVAHPRHAAAVRLHVAWSTLHDAKVPVRRPDNPLVERLWEAHVAFAAVSASDVSPAATALTATDVGHRQIPLARPTAAYRLRRAATYQSHAATTALRVFVASTAAGLLTIAFGLGRPDWAVISAVLVLQAGPDRRRGTVRGIHRLAGTVVGVGLFMLAWSLSPSGVVLILLLMTLQFVIELYIARNYAVAVSFITPLALLIGGASHPGANAVTLGVDRLVETALGVACALASMWLVSPRASRRWLRWSDRRVVAVSTALLDHLETEPPSAALELRRDLQFELVGAAMAAEHSAHDDREWTARVWPGHTRVDELGYGLLAQCWATPDGRPFEADEDWRKKAAEAGVG
ncbi:FUSC family protein [Actinomycetes bacterium M1A6_2h]